MSPVGQFGLSALALAGFVFGSAYAQITPPSDLRDEGRASWSSVEFQDGLATTARGPASFASVRYDGRGVLNVHSTASARDLAVDLVPPASIVWAPSGRLLAINNGDGSGQFSNLVIVDLRPSTAPSTRDFQPRLRRYFASQSGCRIDPDLVSIRAVGWTRDSKNVFVSPEAWDRDNPCDSDIYMIEMDVETGNIVRHFSRDGALTRFCSEPEFYRRFQPNCDGLATAARR